MLVDVDASDNLVHGKLIPRLRDRIKNWKALKTSKTTVTVVAKWCL